jgi:predicted DNA-binding transcriptional regulator AlpA
VASSSSSSPTRAWKTIPDHGLDLSELLVDPTRVRELPVETILALREEVRAEQARLDAAEEALVAALVRRATSGNANYRTKDSLVAVDEAARLLGMSKDWIYDHASELPFTRRIGRSLRFSVAGIRHYQARRPT